MRACYQRWIMLPAVIAGLCLAGLAAGAQNQSDAEKVLIQKAQALEARGRPDIAVQVWQQILLSDPNNAMALEGVARDYRLSGNSTASDEALDKLRRVNPSDPNIGKIQGLTSNRTRDQRLGQAGSLAKAGNPEAAMKIYREYYGDHPPDGDIALAYYETLYATGNGKSEALNAMRTLATRNPGDPRFIVTLGRMLTYDPRTRGEGIKILHEHAQDSDAENSLRQALIWDSSNPTSAAELREYLKSHPKDTELETRLRENEGKLAQMNSGIARTPAEKAAFAALNAHRLDEAQARFMAMLDTNEKDARAAAGMGFLRMQQSNFGGAISYLEQAEQNGFRDRSVAEGLATSRFWYTMGEASTAFDANQLDEATNKYKDALAMRPRSPEALNGLAGVYTKQEQYPLAAAVYQQILRQQPRSGDAWRGLFLAYARNNQNSQAIAVLGRFPAPVKATLSRDPDFLRTLASIYHSQGRDGDAQRILAEALALPFPDNGANLKNGTRLEYAGILMEAKRYDQAAELYKQVLNEDTGSLPAWMGLVTADHQLTLDHDAIDTVEKMPPATYESALADPGFLSMLGSIYAQSNQFEIAQGLFERTVKLDSANGGQPPVSLLIQLASIYLQRNNTAQAYELYRQILTSHPDNLDAWRGLIGTLQSTNRNTEALQEIQLIPPAVRKQLETNIQFEQSEASLYAATGDTVNAMAWFNRVVKHYQALREDPPADVEIQSAYLLYNAKNDRALYPELMRLGGRQDLTIQQRQTIQGLWANWSVRRSATAFANGNTARAIDILDAAAQAFPDNLTVRKAVAGGYLTAGRAKESLEIFKTIDMQDATAGDWQGAIGAALTANDKAQTEEWLRQALAVYPRDAAILGMAARFEQARGDNGRAADYWRASIAVMPQVSPTDKLAHELVNPEPGKATARAATPRDLASLLNPDDEPFSRSNTVKLPALPSYGPDPMNGSAPVVLTPRTAGPSSMPVYPVPTTTTVPLPSTSQAIPYNTVQAVPSAPAPRRRVRRSTAASSQTNQTASVPATTTPRRRRSSGSVTYTGRMNLPPSDENVTSTNPADRNYAAPSSAAPQPAAPYQAPQPQQNMPVTPYPQPQQQSAPQTSYPQPQPQQQSTPVMPSPQPQPNLPIPPYPQGRNGAPTKSTALQPVTAQATPLPPLRVPESANTPTIGLRLSAQPMNPLAARTQALLIDQTDGQITQGFTVHYLPNATSSPIGQSTVAAHSLTTPDLTMSAVQYTPSAQDAAAGAYSAQKSQTQQAPQPPPLQAQPPVQQTQQPAPQTPSLTPTRKTRRRSKPAPSGPSVPTLVTAPGEPVQQQLPVTDGPTQTGQSTTNTGLTDEELQERNLPPLKGPWVRVAHAPAVLSPREEAEMQLRTIEGGYSAWLGGTGILSHRSGAAGYDALTALEAPFEASFPLGTKARLTFIAKPVFLDSGQADGNAVVQLTTVEGQTPIGSQPEPLGSVLNTNVASSIPNQQNAVGVGGEVQFTFANLSVAGGYTPSGFLVANFTGRANWRPGRGPFTFSFIRDSVKDTQLSYSGLRDPGSANQTFPGQIWGGVIANAGTVQYAKGDLASGFYVGAGGQYITGHHVVENKRVEGSMGAYWRVKSVPEYGTLNIGANFFAMHYSNNEQAFTLGQGGYFSPQAYFLANVPITWTGHYLTHWHYTILGSLGIQAFEENIAPLFPLDKSLEVNSTISVGGVNVGNLAIPALTSVGPNYDLRGQVAYGLSEHWFVGGFAGANNSRNYTSINAGFSVRYLFRPQPSTVAGPTGLFQVDDQHALRPLTVP